MIKMKKNKINNGKTKQKYIYIFNRVAPEKVLIHLVQLSELVQTIPSVNYTHLKT